MVCRALNELDDVAVEERRVLIAMDGPGDLGAAIYELPSLNLEAFAGNRFQFVRRVAATALRERISLALIGHVNHAPLGLMLKRMRPGLRYGIIVYGVEAWSRLSPLKRRALRAADFVVSISEHTGRQLVERNGVNPERVHLLPCTLAWKEEGQRAESKESRATAGEPASDLRPLTSGVRLLSVCRLDEREQYKGVDTVIKALPAVLERVPDLEYVVIGGGTDLARHRRLADGLGVSSHVQFRGSVDEETLRSAYRECDVFVLPSAGEGFGIVFLEAMHDCKPIIAANSAATPEVVVNGETGMLVEAGNVAQLAAAMIALCTNRSERERMGDAGYDRLQSNFTFDHFKRRLHEIVLAELPGKSSDHGEHQIARSASSLT